MTERFYGPENVLELVRRVFNISVLKHNERDEYVCNIVFPMDKPGEFFTMSSGGKGDLYDNMYCLLYQIAKFKDEGKMPEKVMLLEGGDSHPVDVAIDLLKEKHLMSGETNDGQ